MLKQLSFYTKIGLLFIFTSASFFASAKEGMWIPSMLEEVYDDMQAKGLKLSPEEIYSINKSSLKDKIVHFGGGCTAELISKEGLILTNHHCGYSQIQSHSSVENDYLTDGFWAYSKKEELANPGLTATFITALRDVTEFVLENVDYTLNPELQTQRINENIEKLLKPYKEEKANGVDYEVKSFYHGNQYIMIITKTFEDVRLVGAPPSSIGKFGADTDNWMWPRHTGDFSLFRIYANEENEPAAYSASNKPYSTKEALKINIDGIEKGDFTMVYGFPGRTQQYLPSYAVDYVVNVSNPAKINMRDHSLEIINSAMRSSKELRIKYAAKQSRISNAWKKWMGESRGLKKLDAINKKQMLEKAYLEKVASKGLTTSPFATVLEDYKQVYAQIEPYELARDMFIEIFYYGPEIIRFANGYKNLIDLIESDTTQVAIQAYANKMLAGAKGYFKDYDQTVDRQLMQVMLPLYAENVQARFTPPVIIDNLNDMEKFTDKLYKKSMFSSYEKLESSLKNAKKSLAKKIKKDPAYELSKTLVDFYFNEVKPERTSLKNRISQLDRVYMKGLMDYLPEYKDNFYPDANSTLRLAYGNVKSYEPRDGVSYHYQTTLDGVMEKEDSSVYEFRIPTKLKELHRNKDYGMYGEDGKMPVCFIASNHTTGGNSGSPAFDANGNLIGLNFDRVWEGTMSDIMFNPEVCRNIMVDIRYVLFIVDKFAGATNLIKELELVSANGEEVRMQSPSKQNKADKGPVLMPAKSKN